MKLEKLRYLESYVKKELIKNQIIDFNIFYFHENWIELNNLSIPSSHLEHIDLAYRNAIHYDRNTNTSWFYFDSLDYCLAIKSSNSPRSSTREKIRKKITEIEELSLNAYRVAHNPLTHLLSKQAFNEALEKEIKSIESSQSSKLEEQEGTLPKSIALMALDIDYFKQVNDTWGHFYGDQVLKTFAMRLEQTAKEISKNSDLPTIYVGHPSGEEFLILISAKASKEKISLWASRFRSKISDQLLPSDSEWAYLSLQFGKSIVEPPPLQDRAITTSIGVALYNKNIPLEEGEHSGQSLLELADTALYRAKAAGRNQVVFFDEILSSCGRVIEQDESTGVVAIDIGSNVGVTVGQEFQIFSTKFTGTRKFTVNDGRTTKTLGTYPKVPAGRVVIFNVQPEISFACFDPNSEEAKTKFEAGSHLEAIPLGSIRHLLPSFSRYFTPTEESGKTLAIEKIQDYINEKAKTDEPAFTIVILLSRKSEYAHKYGTASLNFSLAKIYRSAQTRFHTAKYTEIIDETSICVVGENIHLNHDSLSEFISLISEENPELGILAGAFCKADIIEAIQDKTPPLSAKYSLEFARMAASGLGRTGTSPVRHFSHATVNQIIKAQRESRDFKSAYADYQKLKKLDVESASIENLAGLIAGSLGLGKEACEHYRKAISLDPSNLVYKSNFGTAAYRLGEIDSALEIMNKLPMASIKTLSTIHKYGYAIYAAALAKAKISGSKNYSSTRFSSIRKKAQLIAIEIGIIESGIIEKTAP